MAISVGEAVTKAWERMVSVLFKPFAVEKWFLVGFAAWLAYLFEDSGANLRGQIQGDLSGVRTILRWFTDHPIAIPFIAIAYLFAVLAFTGGITFLRARGHFMLLHALTHEKFEIGESWSEYSNEANSAFKYFFAITAAPPLLGGVFVAFLAVIAYSDIMRGTMGAAGVIAFALGILVGLPVLILLVLANNFVRDFVLPVMFVHRIPLGEAWARVRGPILGEHKGELVLFYLLSFALAIAAGVVTCVATCLTLCATALPYIGTVILLPIYIFFRCYSLCFLQQLGPDFWSFPAIGAAKGPPVCPACGYDLRGNPFTETCPECGVVIPPNSFDLSGYAAPAAPPSTDAATATPPVPTKDVIDDADLIVDLPDEQPKGTNTLGDFPPFPEAPPPPTDKPPESPPKHPNDG